MVRWTDNAWSTSHDVASRDTGLGRHAVDLPITTRPAGTRITFTCYWPADNRWEGSDFSVLVSADDPA